VWKDELENGKATISQSDQLQSQLVNQQRTAYQQYATIIHPKYI
jgi:hypothetical protein